MDRLGVPVMFDGYEVGGGDWSFNLFQNEYLLALERRGCDVYIENVNPNASPMFHAIARKGHNFDGIGIRMCTEDAIDEGRTKVRTDSSPTRPPARTMAAILGRTETVSDIDPQLLP